MPPVTRTGPRPSARLGRTGTPPSSGRFARTAGQGRPRTSPKPKPKSTRGTSRTSSAFGRMSGGKSKKQKGLAGAIGGLLPTRAASKAKSGSRSGKAGGFAALAGAAGLAYRNRDKLSGLFNRGGGQEQGSDVSTPSSDGSPAAPNHSPTTPPMTPPA